MIKYVEMFADTEKAASTFWEHTSTPAKLAFKRGEDGLGVMMLTGGIQNKEFSAIPQKITPAPRKHSRLGGWSLCIRMNFQYLIHSC